MRPKKKVQLAKCVESLSKEVSQDQEVQLARVGDKIYLTPVYKYAATLRKQSDTLLEEGGWGRKLSGDYVEEGIKGILLELSEHPTGNRALPLLEQLADSFDAYNEQRTVYVPLEGIKMTDVEELHLGDVVLKKMTEDQKKEVAQAFDTEEDSETFLGRLGTVPYAEVTVVAEPVKAWEVAQDRMRDVLDLLRYLMPFLSNEYRDPDINLLGSNASSLPLAAVHSGKFEDLFGSFRDLPTSVEISQEAMKEMEDLGFFEAVKFAGKEEKTDLERAVLRGIQWASNSQGQRQYGNKLLNLIIALECLLPSERSGGSNWNAEGVALLLGPNPPTRRAIRDRVRGLYRKRNNVVHGGESEEVTRNDVVWARMQVHNLISTIINRRGEFEDQEGTYHIDTWLENRKLEGGP